MAAFLALFFIMAFRDAERVGNDSATSYLVEFWGIQTADLTWPNPGLVFVMKVIHHFTNDYQWVIVITAAFVCFAYYNLLIKYSENGFISVIWFMGMLFYTFLFSALKQAWAMAFLCFAFDAVFKKKPFRFLVFVGLATLFHFPALIFLPAYWIAKLKINRAFPILMFGILVFVFVFRAQILDLMTSAYSKGEEEINAGVRFFGAKFIFMLLMLTYGFYQYYKHKYNKDMESNLFSALIYFMGMAAVIQTFCFYNNIFERLADYYYQFSILFVPFLLSRKDFDSEKNDNDIPVQLNNTQNSDGTISKKKLRNYSIADMDISSVLAIIITVFCVWRFISVTLSGSDNLTPFYFFWQ